MSGTEFVTDADAADPLRIVLVAPPYFDIPPKGYGGVDPRRHEEGRPRRQGLRRPLQRPARARDRARRAQRARAGHVLDQDPWQRPRRRRQAVAPEGHGPRPRRLVALPGVDRRRRGLRAPAAPLHLQGQPQGATRRAAQRPERARRPRHDRRARHRRVRHPLDQEGRRPGRRLVQGRLGAARAQRGAGQRGPLVPQPQAHLGPALHERRHRRPDRRLGAADQPGGARRAHRPRQGREEGGAE